jgi:hypothetical protein
MFGSTYLVLLSTKNGVIDAYQYLPGAVIHEEGSASMMYAPSFESLS